MIGGGMRQAGILAAAGLVAMDSMIDRLAEDHANARQLAQGLANINGLSLDPNRVQTNIVMIGVDPGLATAQEFIGALDRQGVKVSYPGQQSVRMVTHRHIDNADVQETLTRVSTATKQLK